MPHPEVRTGYFFNDSIRSPGQAVGQVLGGLVLEPAAHVRVWLTKGVLSRRVPPGEEWLKRGPYISAACGITLAE